MAKRPSTKSTTVDPILDEIRQLRMQTDDAILNLYDAIRAAKQQGYSYSELETVTGFPRGTMQAIIAGQNPRITPIFD